MSASTTSVATKVVSVPCGSSKELEKLNREFQEMWRRDRKDPSEVHAHRDTLDRLKDDILKDVPPAERPTGQLQDVNNPATGRRVRVVEDDVPEGRYYYAD